MSLSNEEKIICLLSRLKPSKEDIERTRSIVTSSGPGIDYGRLVRIASLNGVAPLLYNNLRDREFFPEKLLSKLRYAYLLSVAGNLRKGKELIRLLDLLKRRGIEAIPVKGVFASELIFENPGFYYGSDIDILVKPSDLQGAKHILMESGYACNEENERDMLSSHYHLVFQNDRHLVEVHWNLVKRYFKVPAEFWWEDIYEEWYEGRKVLCLAPEKYLICTIFRLFSHMYHPLKFFVLVSEICNKYYDRIDWLRFRQFIKTYGMEKMASFTLKLSNELLGTKVPKDIKDKNVVGYALFRTSVINSLFKDVKRPFVSKILYIFLLGSSYRILRHFLMRVFPQRGELRLRYGIPAGSKAIVFYYALNPFLLPFLVLRKRVCLPFHRTSYPRQDNIT